MVLTRQYKKAKTHTAIMEHTCISQDDFFMAIIVLHHLNVDIKATKVQVYLNKIKNICTNNQLKILHKILIILY